MRKIKTGRNYKCHHESCCVTLQVTPYTLLSIRLYLQVFIRESLVWLKAPDLPFTFSAGTPRGLCLDILVLSCVVEIL